MVESWQGIRSRKDLHDFRHPLLTTVENGGIDFRGTIRTERRGARILHIDQCIIAHQIHSVIGHLAGLCEDVWIFLDGIRPAQVDHRPKSLRQQRALRLRRQVVQAVRAEQRPNADGAPVGSRVASDVSNVVRAFDVKAAGGLVVVAHICP